MSMDGTVDGSPSDSRSLAATQAMNRMSSMARPAWLVRLAPLACAPAFAFLAGVAQAQSVDTYPSKQIKLVVPYTPGSGVDTTARLIAEKLPAALGGTALVDNRPGASGMIGTSAVARAAPDGLTLLVAPTTHVITAAVRKLEYNPITDFAPVAQFSRGSFLVVVPATSPAKTFGDLVQLLKASKGESAYSSAGIASTVHLFTEMLLRATDTKARHIPGKGVTGALMDVLQAQVDFTVTPVELTLPQIKSGKIRLLAQTAGSRSKLVADVPTVNESGYPGFEATFWIGLYAPAGTPPAGSMPFCSRICSTSGRASTSFSARFNLATMAGGVPAGA